MSWDLRHSIKERGRRLAARVNRWRYPAVFGGVLGDQEASLWITEALRSHRPVLVGRLGSVEARLLGEARFGRFSRVTCREAHRNAGIFPADPEELEAVAVRLGSSLEAVDLLALWDSPYQARLTAQLAPMPERCSLAALEPWWQPNPWSAALAGQRVLVVHPFAQSIQSQWQRRERLFPGTPVLPEFELQVLQPPLTLAGATAGFVSWSAALDDLIARTRELRFDVALLGCGAYGLPLAAAIKGMGRPVLQLGGALQLLFGIRGRRWEAMPPFAALMNEHWVRPLPEETPVAADKVDGGCYW